MNGEAVITLIGSVIAALAAICAVITFVLNRKKAEYDKGKDDSEIKGDIKYMRNGFDDMRLDLKDINRSQDQQKEKLIRVEESCKQAHKRIDTLERKGEHENE